MISRTLLILCQIGWLSLTVSGADLLSAHAIADGAAIELIFVGSPAELSPESLLRIYDSQPALMRSGVVKILMFTSKDDVWAAAGKSFE